MMLSGIRLFDFKNYHEVTLSFTEGVNCFAGNNGSGKTNLLDAIHYLSLTRSYFTPVDGYGIRHDQPAFSIHGDFISDGLKDHVVCTVRQGQKKSFRVNNKEYERLRDHIGKFPVVMIAPTDQELITEGSEIRRRFMDQILSQYDRIYLDDLIRYNQVLMQRNSLLKQAALKGGADWSLFSVWDEQLVQLNTALHEKRGSFIKQLQPIFQNLFSQIAVTSEKATLEYDSSLNILNSRELIEQNRTRDLTLQYTSSGIHKDDIKVLLNGHQARKYASQGQQKSLVISLKLAHFEFLISKGMPRPVLLLDDIFDKLDEERVRRLLQLVSKEASGQIFITDTHPERVPSMFNSTHIPVKVFHVENGKATEAAPLSQSSLS